MVFALFLLSLFPFFFFFFCFTSSFYFSFLFSCSYSSLFILFLFYFCFCPAKPELNLKPQTLHPISGETPSAGQPSAGQPSAGQPSAGQPSAGPPKISLFFFPPPATIFILLSLSLGVLPWWGRRGSTRQPESPNVHISASRRFKHHQNSTRPPRETQKRANWWRERGKKSAKFWAPSLRGPTLRGPTFSGFRAPPFGPLPFGAPPFGTQKGACSSRFFRCSVFF